MSPGDWASVALAGAAWTSIIVAIEAELHRRRTKRIEELRQEILGLRAESQKAHAQLGETIRSIPDNYVQRRDFQQQFRDVHTELTETRKEIGAVHNRIDELFRSVQFRGGRAT